MLTGASETERPFFGVKMPKVAAKSNETSEGAETAPSKSRREIVRGLLSQVEKNFKIEKITLADFIRLTQLERELEDEEQPREIIVTWSEPPETQDVEK